MLFQRPFGCHLSTASGISKRLFSYHPRLKSFILSKFSISPPPFTIRSSDIHNFVSNANSLQSLRRYIAPYRTVYSTKLPFERAPQHRNLIIQANSDNASEDDSDDEEERKKQAEKPKGPVDPKKHKPLFDPFNKKPVIQEPDDPTDLQDVFHKMREDGLVQQAVKMFDALSKDGLTHEAMKLFGQMKDKSRMPDVVAHTAVVEAYAKAGKPKDALKVFMRMQASGCLPNSYSYSVLIQGLCQGGMLQEAGKYTLEMLGYGWKPNAATYVTLVDSYLRAQKADEMRQLLVKLNEKGFVADDKAARQHMKSMGRFNRGVMDMLFGQYK